MYNNYYSYNIYIQCWDWKHLVRTETKSVFTTTIFQNQTNWVNQKCDTYASGSPVLLKFRNRASDLSTVKSSSSSDQSSPLTADIEQNATMATKSVNEHLLDSIFGVRTVFGFPIQNFKMINCAILLGGAYIQTWPLLFFKQPFFTHLLFCF